MKGKITRIGPSRDQLIGIERIRLRVSSSYEKHGKIEVRMPDTNGIIPTPASWTNSLIQVNAVY